MADVLNAIDHCRQELRNRLKEPAPGRIQLLIGPRQVGKTTLLHELAAEFGGSAGLRPSDLVKVDSALIAANEQDQKGVIRAYPIRNAV